MDRIELVIVEDDKELVRAPVREIKSNLSKRRQFLTLVANKSGYWPKYTVPEKDIRESRVNGTLIIQTHMETTAESYLNEQDQSRIR